MSSESGDSDPLSWLCRSQLILGRKNIEKLNGSHVLVIGLGGVGSFAAESLVRSGVGEMTIVDGDTVDPSNRNRQLPALATTHGLYKADVMEERLKAINPNLHLHIIKAFLTPDKIEDVFKRSSYDYLVDAIDSMTPKCIVIATASRMKMKSISAMGAGGIVDPTRIRVCKLSKTENDPLAHQVKNGLKLLKMKYFKGVKVISSFEPRIRESLMYTDGTNFKKSAYGTMSYMPAMFGMHCASVVIRGLTDDTSMLQNLEKRGTDLKSARPEKSKKKRGGDEDGGAKKKQKQQRENPRGKGKGKGKPGAKEAKEEGAVAVATTADAEMANEKDAATSSNGSAAEKA